MSQPRCPACRYDRSGLPAGALCPECGSRPPIQRDGRDHVLDPAASRALIALGLSILAWIGLVGFGLLGALMGLGACGVAIGARRTMATQVDPDPGTRLMISASLTLGVTATLAGLGLFVWLLGLL